jgi:multiple sugar transport system permease protein
LSKRSHFDGTRIGLIIIYSAFNLPYVVWTMINFFEDIPIELDEAAALDRSTILGTLCQIMVPIAAPGIIATAIFAFILCWSEFLFAVIFTSSTAQTLPVAIASFVTDRGIEWGKMSAAGSVLIVPLTVLFYSIQRFLIRGLSFGAIAECSWSQSAIRKTLTVYSHEIRNSFPLVQRDLYRTRPPAAGQSESDGL